MRMYWLALMEATAYAFCSASTEMTLYDTAKRALIKRFGRTVNEVVGKLLTMKQGDTAI